MKDYIKSYFQPPFLLSFLILIAFASGMSLFKTKYGVTLIKKPLPLQQPFDMLDESLLAPYKVIEKSRIENRDVLESLGTEEYLQWFIEDAEADEYSPVKNCSVFITYYTGNPDQVPHVPEACYTGGGNEIREKFSVNFDLSDANLPEMPKDGKVPATGLIFSKKSSEIWQAAVKYPVIYFFKVNGQYKGGRTSTRTALGSLTSEYSYFSKVEIKFFNTKGLNPNKEEAIAATEKLLRVLLPVLEKNHWPDWEEVNRR